jgi:hypothetical protein
MLTLSDLLNDHQRSFIGSSTFSQVKSIQIKCLSDTSLIKGQPLGLISVEALSYNTDS